MSEIKYKVYVKDESVAESIYKDFVTLVMVLFCVYISQDSKFWTFVAGIMFITFMFAKISAIMNKASGFKSKQDLQNWVDSLDE